MNYKRSMEGDTGAHFTFCLDYSSQKEKEEE